MNKVRTVLLSTSVIIGSLFTAPAASADAGSPTISLSLGGGPPTSVVSISGSGFRAGEPVDVYVGTRRVGTGTASGNGTLAATSVTVPAATPPGTAPVLATGRISQFTAQNRFVVRTDWAQTDFAATHQSWNPYESTINRSNAASLRSSWSTIGPALAPAPVVAGSLVLWTVFGTGARRATTGGSVWHRDDISGHTVAGGLAYLNASRTALAAVDLYSGATRWTAELPLDYGEPTAAAGALYVPTPNGPLTKLDAATGRQVWSVPGPVGYGLVSVSGGTLFVAGPHQTLQARSTSTGNLLWTRTSGKLSYYSHLAVQGAVLLAQYDTGLLALDAGSGAVRWSTTVGTRGAVAATTTEASVADDAGTTAFDLATGSRRWNVGTGGPLVVANGLVYTAGPTGVAIRDAATGAYVTGVSIERGGVDGLLVADGRLLVKTLQTDGQGQYLQDFLYSFALPAGPAPFVTLADKTPSSGPNHLTYSAGWKSGANAADYQGSDSYTSTKGASATFTFTGTGFRMWFSAASHHGIATVTADRKTATGTVRTSFTVDEYSAVRHDGVSSATSPPLPSATYTVTVSASGNRNPASTGTTVSLDRIDLGRI